MMTRRNPSTATPGYLTGKVQKKISPEDSGQVSKMNPHSQNGIDLWEEIEAALNEKDILTLREQLQRVSSVTKQEKSEPEVPFDLSERMDIPRFLDQLPVSSEELATIRDPLPKIHVHNHHRALKENVHQLYKEQSEDTADTDNTGDFPVNTHEWEMIGEAIMEKDIMDLRESLQHIVSAEMSSATGQEEIEMYLEGEMNDLAIQQFEDELIDNEQLRLDLQLNTELEQAISEKDIMELRSMLEDISERQNSTSRTQKDIEAFLDDHLSESEKASFMEELSENEDLRAAVNLERELRASLSEPDVIQMRKTLNEIPQEEYTLDRKIIIPVHKMRRNFVKAATVAAIFVFVAGISILMQNSGGTGRDLLSDFLQPPQSLTTFRSAERVPSVDLQTAFRFYNQSDYLNALVYFRKVVENESSNQMARFYSGVSYQGLNRFENAVIEYNRVVQDNDNIFVEQAEWYRAMCYLKLGKKETALAQLTGIIEKEGFYERNAKLLLRKYKMR